MASTASVDFGDDGGLCVHLTFARLNARFVLHLTSESSSRGGALSIMEANRFRHVSLLTLHLNRASDVEIKRSIATAVQSYKVKGGFSSGIGFSQCCQRHRSSP